MTCVCVLVAAHKAWRDTMAIVLLASQRLVGVSPLLELLSPLAAVAAASRRCRRLVGVFGIVFIAAVLLSLSLSLSSSSLLSLSRSFCRRWSLGAFSLLLPLALDLTVWVVKLARVKKIGL